MKRFIKNIIWLWNNDLTGATLPDEYYYCDPKGNKLNAEQAIKAIKEGFIYQSRDRR